MLFRSKYSPCGSKIFIRLQKRNDLVRMEIEDQGIGIPQNEYHKIFQRFYRGNSKAVSYTHLDVYKRQIELCGIESSITQEGFWIDQRMLGKEVLQCRD